MESSVFKGTVIPGDRLGRTIGFPTANLKINDETVVPAGVFACRATLQEGRVCHGMMNVGNRPTVNLSEERRVEVHLFDFEGDLYGQEMQIEIVAPIRGEKKFESLQALKDQLEQDRVSARQVLQKK